MLPSNRSLAWLGLALVLGITASFAPVLSGGFLFDDFANLKALGEYGPIRDLEGIARYLTHGIADPLGRPVAMASFLVDARDWPAEPGPFLRSNLVVHIVNSLLLALLLARLGRLRGLSPRLAGKAALAASALWAMHPLWVSTVGYVVQRHAMLAATFVLLGVLAWLLAVTAFREGNRSRGWLLAAGAMPACGVLAALSKANGMLLPLLVLVLHFFVIMRPAERSPSERHAVVLLLVFPSILLVAALLATIDPDPPGRAWSLAERLMSQPRALADYLAHLAIPQVDSVGLFADGFQVSTSWTSPCTTLPAAVFILGLVVAPFALRRRFPALAGALAFYFAGHVMESSILPLELYFEHRNYLPAMLLGWPLALHLLSHPWQARTGPPILGLLLLVLAFVTFQRALLWADQPRQAAVWALSLPDSPRAQTWAAQHEMQRGQIKTAKARLSAALENHPTNAMLALNLMDIECLQGQLAPATVERAAAAVAKAGAGEDMVHSWLRGKVLQNSQNCPELDRHIVARLVQAAATASQDNSRTNARQRRLEGMLDLSFGRCVEASRGFLAAQGSERWASEAYGDAALLASRCEPEVALSYLGTFLASSEPDAAERPGMLRLHQKVLRRQGYWQDELTRLQAILRSEVAGDRPEAKSRQ